MYILKSFLRDGRLSLGRSKSVVGSLASLERPIRPESGPFICEPSMMNAEISISCLRAFSRGRLYERQCQSRLVLILALLVGITDFTEFLGSKEENLSNSFAGVNLCRQRSCVADLNGDSSTPFRLEQRDVHNDAAAGVCRLAHADRRLRRAESPDVPPSRPGRSCSAGSGNGRPRYRRTTSNRSSSDRQLNSERW